MMGIEVKKVKKFVFNFLLFVISLLCICYISLELHKLGALPLKYEFSIIGILLVVVLLLNLLALRVKNKVFSWLMKLLIIILSVCSVFGGYFIKEGVAALKKMTRPEAKVNEMSLVVVADSPIDSLEEIDTVVFVSDGSSYFNTTMQVIKQANPNVRFTILDDHKEVMENLYNQDIDALLIREAHRSTYEEVNGLFSIETKVIWNHLITEEVVDISKDVNVVNTPFTVYLSGIDTYGDISYVSRTDVNMLVTINPNTKQVLLTSIPRDCWVILENMGKYDKLTHSGLEGPENSVATIENFLGIDINYFARVNFTSLIKIVDAIGGITIENPVTFTCYYPPKTTYEKGTITLDGTHALEYARERHAFDNMFEDSERGDQIRVENQQRVVEGIANKVLSPALLTSFQDVLTALEGTFETNISTDEMMKLVKMQLDDMAEWEFISQKVLGEYEYRYGGAYMPGWELIYYIPDEASVKEVVDNINTLLSNGKIKNNS